MSKTATLILRVDEGFKDRLVKAAGKRGMTAYVVGAVEAKMAGKSGTVPWHEHPDGMKKMEDGMKQVYREVWEQPIPAQPQLRPSKEGHRAVYRFGKFDHWEKV